MSVLFQPFTCILAPPADDDDVMKSCSESALQPRCLCTLSKNSTCTITGGQGGGWKKISSFFSSGRTNKPKRRGSDRWRGRGRTGKIISQHTKTLNFDPAVQKQQVEAAVTGRGRHHRRRRWGSTDVPAEET